MAHLLVYKRNNITGFLLQAFTSIREIRPAAMDRKNPTC